MSIFESKTTRRAKRRYALAALAIVFAVGPGAAEAEAHSSEGSSRASQAAPTRSTDRATAATARVRTFGRSARNNMYGMTADRKRVSRFLAPAGGRLTALSAFVDGGGSGSGSGQVVRLVVYSDANGRPDRLLGETRAHTIARGASGRWLRLALPKAVAVVKGRAYHLGIHSGGSSDVARYGNVLAVPSGMRQNDDAASDHASRTFGGSVENVDIGLSVRGHLAAAPSKAGTTKPSARRAPTNTKRPGVIGQARVGSVLRARPGTWRATPSPRFSYRWQRCKGAGGGCASIARAAGPRYRVVAADRGKKLRILVTASNGVRSVRAASSLTAIVRARAPRSAPSPSTVPRGLANLWIDADGGTCTRSARPIAYTDARACGSAEVAYRVANATGAPSTILVKGGSHGRFRITGNRSSSNRIVFAAAPGETPVFSGGYISVDGSADHVTLRGLTAATFGPGFANPGNRFGVYVGPGSTHIRLIRMRAGNFLIQGAQDVAVVGGTFGPCRAADIHQPCEINKVDHYPGAPQPKNIVVDGAYFHDYDLGPSCFKPSDGGTSSGSPDCHWRAMYINGVHNFTLRNSRFRESFIAPWATISGPDAARVGNKNILIENNVFGTGVNYGSQGKYDQRGYGRWESFDFAWCQNASSGVYAYDGVTYRFNSASRATGVFILFSPVGCQGKVRDVKVYGNIGFRNGCDPLVEYGYNVYSNGGKCAATDRNAGAGGRLPFYTQDTHSPARGDFKLKGRRAAPDNLVPVGVGCPARDMFGNVRGRGGFCDAGAHER